MEGEYGPLVIGCLFVVSMYIVVFGVMVTSIVDTQQEFEDATTHVIFNVTVNDTGEIIEEEHVDMIILKGFMDNDTTDSLEYTSNFQCGHFSRTLAVNASKVGIELGGIILGNHAHLAGNDNHIMNYATIDGEKYLVCPQTDDIRGFNQTMYTYYVLYPNGAQVPSKWRNQVNVSEVK